MSAICETSQYSSKLLKMRFLSMPGILNTTMASMVVVSGCEYLLKMHTLGNFQQPESS